MSFNTSFIGGKLKAKISFSIPLWILILITLAAVIFIIAIPLSLCMWCHRCRHRKSCRRRSSLLKAAGPKGSPSVNGKRLSGNFSDVEMNPVKLQGCNLGAVSDVWGGNRFTVEELQVATNGFADENIIRRDFGITYRGILPDHTRVAVKELLKTSFQDERFIAQVQAIGHARHKNLVKLLGYCVNGTQRFLVYEYVNNGNLLWWLQRGPGQDCPLTWHTRMHIIQGIAKGLAYLHEDIEEKIIHQDIKSSHILLDHQWNPKISDYGIRNLQKSTRRYTEMNDVYGFGVLVIEIVSGRVFDDVNQNQPQVLDWLKWMVANQKAAFVVDQRLPEVPSLKELKRILLIALRCVDPDAKNRPLMGEVVHMLEPRDLLLTGEREIRREIPQGKYIEETPIAAKTGEIPSQTLPKKAAATDNRAVF